MSRSCQSGTFSSPTSACRADDAREPADPLGDVRVALVRHRRGALLPAAERLLDLAHLGARRGGGSRARTARATSRRAASAVEQLGVPVARRSTCVETGSGSSPSRSQAIRSTSGSTAAYVPTAPESLPTRFVSSARATRARVAVELERPAGELPAERRRLRVDAVRAADRRSCRRCSSARARRRPRARGRCLRGASAPASWICSASAVSTTSDEVSP